MQIITTFETMPTITASSSMAGYPVSNIALIDPGLTWQPASAGDAWILIDFGSPKTLTGILLNNCNFASAQIIGGITYSFSADYTQNVTLGKDDAQVRKGYFKLTGFCCRYLKIFIVSQALDNGAVYPFVGNVIAGVALDFAVAEWSPSKIKRYSVFSPDGGGHKKSPKGICRHVFNVSQSFGMATSEAFSWDWLYAVVFEDLGYPAGAWIVYHPEEKGKTIKSVIDVSTRFTLEECV